MAALIGVVSRNITRAVWVGLTACSLVSCADLQMGYNVLTYDTAIADTGNQLLLLNAVRASQHYPRSFTSVGQLIAAPPISGSVASTLNFSALTGLQTYNVNPQVQASAGYSQFALGNLNAQAFMVAIRDQVNSKITKSFFENRSWPRELLDLVYVQSFSPTEQSVRSIDLGRKARCAAPTTRYEIATCDKIAEHIDEFASRCRSAHFIDLNERIQEFRSDPNMYYNTAVNYCHYSRFRIFSEERRLVCASRDPACARPKTRSPLDMIGYLGELIAAQNYIDEPYVPLVLFGRSTESDFDFVDVPLFEVKRGEPSGSAAVVVQHAGATYYIPRPDFGSRTEARSLQTLELVLQTVQAATHRDDLPKTLPSYAVISGK